MLSKTVLDDTYHHWDTDTMPDKAQLRAQLATQAQDGYHMQITGSVCVNTHATASASVHQSYHLALW